MHTYAWTSLPLASLVIASLLPTGRTLSAQSCFPGRPAPSCHSFPITELGYAVRVNQGPTATGGNPQIHYLNGEFGWMYNRSPRLALGGAFFAGALVDYAFQFRPGAKARLRYWLGPRTGLDLGAGFVLGKTPRDATIGSAEQHRLGAAAHLGLSFHDGFLLIMHGEYLKNPQDDDLAGYVGARFGSKPALWTGAIVGPLLGLGALIFSN